MVEQAGVEDGVGHREQKMVSTRSVEFLITVIQSIRGLLISRTGRPGRGAIMRHCAACIALALLPTPTVLGDDTRSTRSHLRGLQGVRVLVDDVSAVLVQNGLTVSAIQADVGLRLRQAGIPVLPSNSNSAILRVTVSILTPSDGIWPYMINVRLDEDFAAIASTWDVRTFGSLGKQDVRTLRDDIKHQIDLFANAYFAVNPKQ